MAKPMQKEDAHKLINQMPSNATWEDLMHQIYVREAIKKSMSDSRAGRTREVRDVRAKYGLAE